MRKMVTVGRKGNILTALALVTLVLTTIGYAQLQFGTLIMTTKEIATVSVDNMDLGTIPCRSAGTKFFSEAISITFDDAFEAGTEVTIKIELVIADSEIYKGFRGFVVAVMDEDTVQALLTLNSPYVEFAYKIDTAGEIKLYDIKVIYATACRSLKDAVFQLGVDVKT